MNERQRLFLVLFIILVIKLVWGLWMIAYSDIHLAPDEAQYWVWSKFLDFGYYSKPPGIAWQIRAGTLFFGDSELGVRFFALIISFSLSVAVYFLTLASGAKARSAFFAAIAMAVCPIGLMASFAATTDGGFVLFWTLGMIILVKSLKNKVEPSYYLFALMVILGALFKWTMFLLWLVPVIGSIFYPKWRSGKLFIAFIISLLAFLPSLVWNYSHDWVTFKHVWTQSPGGGGKTSGNALEFFLAQIGLFSPVFFFFLIGAFFVTLSKKMSEGVRLCTVVTGIIFLLYLCLALTQKMQVNWAIYMYPTGCVILAWFAFEYLNRASAWFAFGAVLAIVLSFLTLSVPVLESNAVSSSQATRIKVPYKLNLFKHSLGWDKLPEALQNAGYDSSKHFLVGDRYQMSSILSFYSKNQQRAYFLNLLNTRKNQFSFWPSLKEERLHQDGFFVVAENRPLSDADTMRSKYEYLLKPYFERVQFIEVLPLFTSYGTVVKWAMIFKVTDFNGIMPIDPDIY